MRRSSIAVLSLFVSASAAFADVEIKGSPNDVANFVHQRADRFRLTGYAEENVQADKATMKFIVTAEKGDLGEAITLNQQARAKAMDSLQARGIDKAAVKTSRFSSVPVKGFFSSRPGSYVVTNTLSIEVGGEQQVLATAELSKIKEIAYTGVTFEYTKRDELRLALIQKACAKMNASREAYEKAMGVKLVPVAIGEQPVTNRPVEFGMDVEFGPIKIGQDSVGFMRSPKSFSEAPASVPPPAPMDGAIPNEMTYGLRVMADFIIERPAGK
ncbi:MAG: SIMPL domain-containing protein [Planctomycetota bacterium]|nr:SIMPL domain-containing protein [Planctomycetota bacterium]